MRILGIETSCDETAISIIDATGTTPVDFEYKILGQALLSQAELHAPYGGVFPNLAKREHAINLVPILELALREAELYEEGDIDMSAQMEALAQILTREPELYAKLSAFLPRTQKPDIDAIAVTFGPGLEPALWVGINFAKALAHVWGLPLIPVNHMEGHIILSACGEGKSNNQGSKLKDIQFPLLSLLISGGHTELVLSPSWMQYELLGQTRDDAVGEAFDKVARLLDLPYPGGPQISRLAAEARTSALASSTSLPRPMIDSKDFDFSFAGLKTAVRRVVEERAPLSEEIKKDIAREFEDAAADVLVAKTLKAIEAHDVKTVLVGGGVSANTHIRTRLAEAIRDYGYSVQLLIPPPELATDNALMIALAGYFHSVQNAYVLPDNLIAKGNLKLT